MVTEATLERWLRSQGMCRAAARAAQVLWQRHFICPPRSYREIGAALGVSGVRIRQIHAEALRRLRQDPAASAWYREACALLPPEHPLLCATFDGGSRAAPATSWRAAGRGLVWPPIKLGDAVARLQAAIPTLSRSGARALVRAGYVDVEAVRWASDAELLAVPYFRRAHLTEVRGARHRGGPTAQERDGQPAGAVSAP